MADTVGQSDPQAEASTQLPSWDDALKGNIQGDSQSSLPTWDDALKQNKSSTFGAVGDFFRGALFDQDTSKEGLARRDALLNMSAVGRIINKFGIDTAESVKNIFDPKNEDSLGFSPEAVNKMYEESQGNWVKGIFYGVGIPAAAALDAAYKLGTVPFTAAQGTLQQTSEEASKIPVVGKAVAFPFGAAAEIAGEPQGLLGIYAPAELVKARSNNVIGKGVDEAVYMGTKPVPPEAAAEQFEASRQSAAYEPAPVEELPTTEEQKTDIHQVARNIAPETFEEYDRLSTSKEALSSHLSFLNEQRQTEAETTAPHTEEIEQLQDKLEDANARMSKIYQARIEELAEKNEAAIAEAKARDTPEMAQVRSRIQDIDYRMRDLAPDVSRAYREAKEHVPEETPAPVSESAAVEKPPEPQQVNAQEVSPELQTKVAAEQHAAIVDDITKKLISAGRPLEEAQASAELTGRFFRTMSEMYGGTKGTAEDWYAKEGANIKVGKERTKVLAQKSGSGRELKQPSRGTIKLMENAKSTITLFKRANASTFMHESAHQFLDIMSRYAKEDGAPERLKSDVNTINKYLGVGDDGIIKDAQHEKFARSFERYLMEGVAPSRDLANIFEKFRKWLTDIYQTVDKLRAPITDDIRDVFDRLLANKAEEPIIAKERPIEKISDGTGLFEGTKMEGLANKLSSMFSKIHKDDAEHTPPQHAAVTADRVEGEIDQIAKTHDKEAYDAITNPETAKVATETSSNEPTSQPAEPDAGTEGSTAEPSAISSVGGEPAAEGGGLREQPETSSGAGPIEAGGNAIGVGEGAGGTESATGSKTDPNQKFGPGKSDLVDKAGNIRLDLLNTTEDINQVLRQTAKENDNFTQERRGVISNGMTLDLADALGMDPAMLNTRKIGQAFSAEQIVAAVKLLVKSAKDVSEAAKSGDIEKYTEARERHKMIQGHVSGFTAEAGRALQIFQSFKKIEGYDQAKAMGEFLKKEDNGKTLNQLAEEMAFAGKLDRPQQISKFIEDSRKNTFKDMILEYYINALISGPITHMRYAVGNAINALWTPLVEIPLAAASRRVGEVISGKEAPDGVHLGEAKAQLYAIGKGSRDGISSAIEAFQKGNSPALPGERVSSQFLDIHQNAIPGKIGEAINTPGRSVASIHSFFKSLRYEQNIAGLAYRQALKEGLEGTDFNSRIAELTKAPTEEMMEKASQDALKELYMAPNDYHSFMGGLTQAVNRNVFVKIIIPFMKIGTQITRNAFVERTPLGLFSKEIRANLLGVNGEAAKNMQMGKIAAGISLMGVTSLMAAEGLATGDGPEDPKERAIWLLNHRPNSIQIGNITIPYQGLGSLGMLMRFSANAYQTAHSWDEEDGAKLAVAALKGVTKSVLDENFMRGVKDALDAVYHPEEYGTRYLQGFVTNWLPFSVGDSQVARTLDPYKREVVSHGWSNAFGIMDEIKAKTPFLSETLEPQRDRFGQPIPNGENDQYKNDPVVQRMEALNIGIGKLERKIRDVPLTDKQYDDFSRLAGTMTKMRLNALIMPGFSTLPNQAQVAAIQKVVDQSREQARKLVMMQNPEIMKSANDAKAIKKYGRSVDGGTP